MRPKKVSNNKVSFRIGIVAFKESGLVWGGWWRSWEEIGVRMDNTDVERTVVRMIKGVLRCFVKVWSVWPGE